MKPRSKASPVTAPQFSAATSTEGPAARGEFTWGDTLSAEVLAHQRERIEMALASCGGNKSQAARLLGIPRSTLFSKLRRLGIE